MQLRVRRGALHVVYPRVYAVGHAGLDREARWMAAVLAAGPGAVLSHLSVAALLGVWKRHATGIDVSASQMSQILARRGIRVHRTRLDPRDITIVLGIPATTLARMLVDLCEVLEAQQIAAVLKEAEFLGKFDLVATHEAMARAGRRARLERLEEALVIRGYGGAGTRSGLEDRLVNAIKESRFEQPRVNVHPKGMNLEVDMVWKRERLCVEVDGPGHERPAVRREDAERDRKLREAGYEVLRFTKHDIIKRPDQVVETIRKALARRKRELGLDAESAKRRDD